MGLRFFTLSFLVVYSLSTFSQSVFSVSDCIEYGLNNAWSTKENQLNIKDAQLQVNEYRAIGLPKLNASVDYQYFIEIPTSILPIGSFGPNNPPEDQAVQFGVKNLLNAGLDFNMLLFDGSYFLGLKAIKSYLGFVTVQNEYSNFELSYMIQEAYYAVLLAEAGLDLIDDNLELVNSTLKETRAFYNEGFIEKLDVDRLELSEKTLQTQRSNQEKLIELSKNALKFHMNFPLDEDLQAIGQLEDYLDDRWKVRNTSETEASVENRPDYKILSENEYLLGLNLKSKEYERFPKLVGFGNYIQQLQGNDLGNADWYPSSIVGLSLSFPIFNGFSIKTKIQRAEVEIDRVQLMKSQLAQAIEMEVRNGVIAVENARKVINNSAEAREQAQSIYDTNKIKFNEGVGSSLDLTQAERDQFNADGSYINAMYDLIIANMKLDKALGILK